MRWGFYHQLLNIAYNLNSWWFLDYLKEVIYFIHNVIYKDLKMIKKILLLQSLSLQVLKISAFGWKIEKHLEAIFVFIV